MGVTYAEMGKHTQCKRTSDTIFILFIDLRETSSCCSTYSCIHWLFLACAWPGTEQATGVYHDVPPDLLARASDTTLLHREGSALAYNPQQVKSKDRSVPQSDTPAIYEAD